MRWCFLVLRPTFRVEICQAPIKDHIWTKNHLLTMTKLSQPNRHTMQMLSYLLFKNVNMLYHEYESWFYILFRSKFLNKILNPSPMSNFGEKFKMDYQIVSTGVFQKRSWEKNTLTILTFSIYIAGQVFSNSNRNHSSKSTYENLKSLKF